MKKLKPYNKLISTFFPFLVLSLLFFSESKGAELKVIPSFSSRFEYDDNITFDDEDEINSKVFSVLPGLRITRRSERFFGDINLNVENLEFLDDHRFDTVNQEYVGNIDFKFTPRLSMIASAGYKRDSDPERDIDVSGLVISTRRDRTLKSFSIGPSYRWDEKTDLSLIYDFIKRNYKEKGPNDPFDDKTQTVTGLITRQLTPEKLALELSGGYRFFQPEDKSTVITQVDDIYSFFFTIGGRYRYLETFTLSGNVGARFSKTDFNINGRSEDDRNVNAIGNLILENQFTEKLKGQLSIRHDVTEASGFGGMTKRTILAAQLSHRLTYRLYADLRATFNSNRSDSGRFSTSSNDRKFYSIDPSIRYQFTPDLSADLTYRYAHNRRSSGRAERSRRNVVFFRISWQIPYDIY